MKFRDYDTRLAAYCLLVESRPEHDGRECVLLSMLSAARTRWGAMWTLPGGGLDYDEGFADAAVREVREETGYDAVITGILGVRTFVPAGRGGREEDGRHFKSAAVIYEAERTGGVLGTLEVDGSTDYAAWVPIVDLNLGDFGESDLPDHSSDQPHRARDGVRVVSTVGYALHLRARVQQMRRRPVS